MKNRILRPVSAFLLITLLVTLAPRQLGSVAAIAQSAAPYTVSTGKTPPDKDTGNGAGAAAQSVPAPQAMGLVGKPSANQSQPALASATCETLLPNGLRVIFLQDHSFPVVSCLTWYRVGARNESPGCTGITHLLEHLLFGEAGSFRAGEIAAQIARNGGQFNGYTSDDFTTFFETLPAGKLELALKIEADRMRHAVFTDKALKDEIANVEHEFDGESTDATASLNRQVRAMLFLTHPYHNPIIGWRSDVESITVQQLRNYYDRYYGPNNCTLVIAGDVKARAALPLLQKYFGSLPKTAEPVETTRFVEQEQRGERRVVVKYAGKQEALEIAYHVAAFDDPDAPALMVLERLLNCAYSGRLKTRLTANKICSQAVASFEAKKDPGFFSITCQALPGMRDASQKIGDALDDLILQLKTQPVGEPELRRARNQAEMAYFSEQDGPYHAGFVLGYFDTLASWRQASGWPDRIRAVSAADIQRVAKRYFTADNRVVAWLSGAQAPRPAALSGKPSGASQWVPATGDEPAHMAGYKQSSSWLSPSRKQTLECIIAQSLDSLQSGADSGQWQSQTADQKPQPAPAKRTAGATVEKVLKDMPSALPTAVKDLPLAVQRVPRVIKGLPAAIGGIPAVIKEIPGAVTGIPSAIKQIPGAIGGIPGGAVSAVKQLPIAAANTIKELPGTLEAMPGAAASALKGMPMALGSVAAQIGTVPGTIGKQFAQEKADKSGVYRRTLKNGVKVVVFQSHLSPVVQIAGACHAGSAYDPANHPGVSAVSAVLLNQGSSTRGRSQCCLQQEDLGLVPGQMLRFQSTADTIKFNTACLSRDLPSQLGLLAETLTSPAVQENDVDKAKQEVTWQLKQGEDTLETRAERALLRCLLSDSSPFAPQEPSVLSRSLAVMQTKDVAKFLCEHLSPSTTAIVVAGDVDPDRAVALVDRALGGWTGKGVQPRLHARAASKHVLRTSIPVQSKGKAAIAFGQLMPVSRSTPDFVNLLIADALLSKHPLFSRLNRQMAADARLSQCFAGQTCEAKMQPVSNSIAWAFVWPVQPDVVPLAVFTLQSEMQKLSADGIKPQELDEMKRFLLGALPVNGLSTLPRAAETLLDACVHADDGDSMFAQLAGVRNATVDSVNKFIKAAMNPQDCTLVVVGSAQVIRTLRLHPGASVAQAAAAAAAAATQDSPLAPGAAGGALSASPFTAGAVPAANRSMAADGSVSKPACGKETSPSPVP